MNDQSKSADPKDPRVEAALRDYLERIDRGETIDREAFLARHARIADELRSFIAAEDEVRKRAGAETPPDRAHDSTKSLAGHGQETLAPQSVGKRATEPPETGLAAQFGRYRIIRALGKGAMGTVYLAEDTHLERRIALKTPHFTADPTGEQMERFFREARAAGTLRHPNICPIHDFGQIDGKHFISMAYIEGHPLSAFIQPDKPQTERQVLILIRKLALALQEAHDHGIVHRDLKPANIMVDKKGEPIIMDFGLARQARRDGDIRLTQTGNILGTPAFMSPEQVEGEPDKIGPPTDQYSLGVILYELVTGQLPFGGSVIAVMGQILTKEPSPPSKLRPDLDPRIEAVCLKMMAKSPLERFPSLKSVADELATILKSPAPKATSKEQPASSPAQSPAAQSPPAQSPPAPSSPVQSPASVRLRADVGASQVLKSLKPKGVTESDLVSLEELARKCYSRRDFEQVIQIIERIPEEKQNAGLAALLEKARGKADEIAFLICDIDEAVRLNHRERALNKAEELLKIKPGHHRALKVQEDFAGYGAGGAARIGPSWRFTQPWNEGGWIPWSVLAFGLTVFGAMCGIIIISVRGTTIVIDVRDPSVEVVVKGDKIEFVTGPQKKKVSVEPGEQELKINYAGLETRTKSFTLKKGQTRTVVVTVVDSKIVAKLDNEILPLIPNLEKNPRTLATAPVGPASELKPINPADAQVPPSVLIAPFTEAAAKTAKEQWANHLHTPVELTNSIGMKLTLIPPGQFTMGSTKEEIDKVLSWTFRSSDFYVRAEQPAHRVKIARPFYLCVHEVTRGDFAKFVTATHYKTEGERSGRPSEQAFQGAKGKNGDWRNPGYPQEDTHPVVNVTGADAIAFCEWLGRKEGRSYRLPREAEWEHACRAGTTTLFYTGDDPQKAAEAANMNGGTDHYQYTSPVGSFPPNPFGLYDMYGNVWEMCQDRAGPNYVGYTAEGDPPSTTDSSKGAERGGGADCPVAYCRSAIRGVGPRSARAANLGFRIVCDVVETPRPNDEAAGFKPLFNGKDLTGWKTHPNRPGRWRVEGGILKGSGVTPSYLFTERRDFKDFHLRVEARINDGGTSGVLFRAPSDFGERRPPGYKAQINSTHQGLDKTGSLHVANGRVAIDVSQSPVGPGEWFETDIIVIGNQMTIQVNGTVTADYRDDDRSFSIGRIGLQQNDPQTVAEFRRIEIKELSPDEQKTGPPTASGSAPATISRRPFLVRGEWRIEGDELVQPSLATGWWRDLGPRIALGEESLSNYDLTFEIEKTGGREAMGILFHWLRPDNYRYFCLAGNGGMDFAYVDSGKWGREEGNWKWRNNASNHWYSLKLEVRDSTFRAYLDGELQYLQTDARFTHGRLCLYTENTAARFRRIKVSDPQGRVLFEGLPELPRGSHTTISKASNVASSRSLTAGETAAQSAQKQSAQRLKAAAISTNSLGMKLALIPPGEFAMGSHKSERERDGIEQQHRVRMTSPFYLGVYAVTQTEFEQVMGRNPSYFSNSGGPAEAETGVDTKRNPVENVTWYDAVEFCNKLSEKDGRPPYYRLADIQRERDGWIKNAKVYVEGGAGYRLPTEAQWEYACRAGTTTPFYFGMAANGAEFNCDGKLPYGTTEQGPALGRTVPVGGYGPNGFGLYDLHGNVNEWCWDLFDPAYYKHSPKSDPTGPSGGSLRVFRGGAWPDRAADCRSAARRGLAPGDRGGPGCLGIRVARSAGE